MPDHFTRQDLTGARVYPVVTLFFAGQVLHLSVVEAEVDSDIGELHLYDAIADLPLEESADIQSDATGQMSIPVEAVLPVDAAALIAVGHDLAGATAEVSQWIEGSAWEERRVILLGRVADPEYGAEGEAVAFSVEDPPWEDIAMVPGELLEVNGTTWGSYALTLPSEQLGLAYPVVIGRPGRMQEKAAGWVTGSQAVWIWEQNSSAGTSPHYHSVALLLAGHHVSAAHVWLNNEDVTAGVRVVVINTYDELGQPVAVVPWYATRSGTNEVLDYDPSGSYVWSETISAITYYGLGHNVGVDGSFRSDAKSIYVGWYDEEDPTRGGLSEGGALVRNAGDVLLWMLQRTSLPVDIGRCKEAARLLDAFQIDTTIEERCKPWDWLRDNLLPLLPVSLCSGPNGLYPAVWRFDAQASDAVATLNADEDPYLQRRGRVRSDSSRIRNKFSLKYGLSLRTGQYTATARLGAEYDAESGALGSLHCRISADRYRTVKGERRVIEEEIESALIYDSATAAAVLEWKAKAFALARREVEYLTRIEDYGWLPLLSVVTLTDSEIGMNSQVALVVQKVCGTSGDLSLKLAIFENPARDRRS